MTTGFGDVDAALAALVPRIHEALGARLLGLYLFGSVASREYDTDVSDIDLLGVLEAPLTAPELPALERLHAQFASELPQWDDRIEVLYVSREALATFRERSSPIAVISPGEPLNVRPAGIEWLMNWWDVRERGVTLFGPDATEFIAPVGREEFVAIIRSYAEEFPGRIEESPYARWLAYITLTMCRSMHTSAEGLPVSKRAAAEWAAGAFPEWAEHIRGALADRLAWREARLATPNERAAAAAFVAFALGQIRERHE